MPEPPSGLRPPPIGAIRSRARRRRAATVVGAAALCLLAAAGIGLAVSATPHASPPPPASSLPAAGTPTPWHFAVVSRDDRTLWLLGGPPAATNVCAPGQVTARAGGDPLVLTAVAASPVRDCQYEVTLRLDAPLGQRTIRDGSTNTPRPVLHDSILPRPTYPTGLSLAQDQPHGMFNAPRPSWQLTYLGSDDTMVMIGATPLATAADIPVSETVTVHGHQIGLWDPESDGTYAAVWRTGDWQVFVVVGRIHGTGGASRAEIRQVVNGLVW